jgi:hypothetical protein
LIYFYRPEICVTDKDGIHIFDYKEKKFLKTIKCENNNFNSIAIDSKNNIVVCDEINGSIQIFNPDDFFWVKKKKKIFEDILINKPCRIIFDKNENLLIGSKENNYITILNYKHESSEINLSVKYCISTGQQIPSSILIDSLGKIFFTSEEKDSIFTEDVCTNMSKLSGEMLWQSEIITNPEKKI